MTKDTNITEPDLTETTTSKADFAPQSAPKSEPQIIRRGGVGFLTATFMSCIAALGGAYLSLFVQSRPDVVQSLKIGGFLPKPANAINNAEILSIKSEIAAIEAHIKSEGHTLGEPIAEGGKLPEAAGLNAQTNAASNPPTANPQTVLPPSTLQNTVPNAQAINTEALALAVKPIRDEMGGLSGRLTAIETRLAALDPTGTGGAIIAALQAEIATLKVTVADLQNKIAHTPSPATTFAVISLAEAANRNGSFMPEFEAVRAALPYLPEVSALEPLARKGAPTRALLSERFATLLPIISATDLKAKEEKGLVGWFRGLLSKVIKVKVNEETNPNAPSLVMARAKQKLDSGELTAAVDELKLIPTPPKELLDWINSANDRLAIEAKISALRGAIERGMNEQPEQIGQVPVMPAAANAPIAPPPLVPAPTPIAPSVPAQVDNPAISGAKR